MVAVDSDRIPRVPPYSGGNLYMPNLPVRDCHPLRSDFPDGSSSFNIFLWLLLQPRWRRNANGLGSSHFDRHYFGNRYFFLFLWVLRCFSSPRSLWLCQCQVFNLTGFPIRTSPDQFLFANTRSSSHLTTSFVASRSLGIHRSLLFSFSEWISLTVHMTFSDHMCLLILLVCLWNCSPCNSKKLEFYRL